jgi:hypothetical protein
MLLSLVFEVHQLLYAAQPACQELENVQNYQIAQPKINNGRVSSFGFVMGVGVRPNPVSVYF